MKYFGSWASARDVERDFSDKRYWDKKDSFDPIANFPKASEILLAEYAAEAYGGSAFVLFERDGKLYEVNAGHCSCYGLEGQWSPEETTWSALAMRRLTSYGCLSSPEAKCAFLRLVKRHTA